MDTEGVVTKHTVCLHTEELWGVAPGENPRLVREGSRAKMRDQFGLQLSHRMKQGVS